MSITLITKNIWLILLVLILPVAFYLFRHAFVAIFAKQIAMRKRLKIVQVFGGLFQYVLWEPNDGVIFLRNKRLWERYPIAEEELGRQGGAKWITVFRGEELKAHFPVKDNSFVWESPEVLTREGVKVGVKINIYWRVKDIEHFIFRLGESVRIDNDKYEATLTVSAEERIRSITESNIRTILASASIITLSPTNVANYLQGGDVRFIEMQSTEKQSAIEHRMIEDINKELSAFGIQLDNLKIVQVTLPPSIASKIEEIHKKALTPIEAQLDSQSAAIRAKQEAEAAGQKIAAELRAYIDTLGQEGALTLLSAKAERDAGTSLPKRSTLPSPEVTLKIGIDKKADES